MNITELKGIGAKTAENFNRLSVYTVSDLVGLYPRDYDVYHEPVFVKDISHESEHTEVAVEGQVCKSPDIYGSGRLKILTVTIKDYNGDSIKCSWYNMPFLKNTLRLGTRYVFRGRLVNKRGWLLEQPKMYTLAQYKELQGTLQPIYPLTKGLTNNAVTKAVAQALEKYSAGLEKEYIPDYIRKRYSLAEHNFSVVNIHFPKTMEEYVQARHRLAFEEFFLFTLATLSLKSANERIPNSYVIPESKEKNQFLESLSYSLTNAQLRTVSEVAQDMSGEHLCSRLIQGDVGSGKTVVATIALINTVIAGYQGALMAPTEILAAQHYKTLSELYDGTGIRTELLIGQTRASEKKEILSRLASGEIDILVGTHSLIEDPVEFAHLGMVVTDEQHRFGVKQRERLETKGDNPHILVMTATPIPRTMALSVYGDLDVSSIRHLPPGRQPVGTYAVGRNMLARIYRFMKKEMNMGHQVYVVCPLVEESEKADLAAAVSVYEELRTKQFPEFCLGLVHGQMKAREKDEVTEAFVQGKIQMLVATSVIEVGVNVPNATIMFIYGADRFGLSQLHQLRGRVGRGKAKSYCILYSDNTSEAAEFRLSLMTKIQDGFTLAEKDLLLRGSGEFFGTRQHGMDDLKVANVIRDLPILEEARKAAREEISHGLDVKEELARRFHGEFFSRIYH